MDAIFQFFDNLTWIGWTLIILAILILWVVISKDEETIGADGLPVEEEDDTEWHTDIITCSVPGQQVIQFLPWEYSDYDFYSYDGYLDITLKNGNTCYLPIGFTTIIDETANKITLTTKE